MKKKKKSAKDILANAEKWGGLLSQAAQKADMHQKPQPETPGEMLGWLIDEWVIQSDNGWRNYKDGVAVEKESESEFRFRKAAKLAELVNALLDLDIHPVWPWADNRKLNKIEPCDMCGYEFKAGDDLYTHGRNSTGAYNTRCVSCEKKKKRKKEWAGPSSSQ